MGSELGPQARRVYRDLSDAIGRGTLAPGARLPPQSVLAGEFGVALMTVRQALARLEAEGQIASEQGRGTFVRAGMASTVLIVDDDPLALELLGIYVAQAGYGTLEVGGPEDALVALSHDPSICLIITDVCMPTAAHGIEFIRAVHRRWPGLWVVAVTGAPEELRALHGTPECPMLVLAKPVQSSQIERLLGLLSASESLVRERVR